MNISWMISLQWRGPRPALYRFHCVSNCVRSCRIRPETDRVPPPHTDSKCTVAPVPRFTRGAGAGSRERGRWHRVCSGRCGSGGQLGVHQDRGSDHGAAAGDQRRHLWSVHGRHSRGIAHLLHGLGQRLRRIRQEQRQPRK